MQTRRLKRSRRKPRASTADVVGNTHLRASIPPKWQKHYHRLIRLRDEMLRRQVDLVKDASQEQPAFSSHMADAGTDTYDRDFALGLLSSEQDAVYEVEQALDRIRTGEYGICELTGKRIEPDRLEAIPWTRFSSAAEAQLEREGSLRQLHLGPRGTVNRT
jgi:RNA polymerase-binding transcription factor DksA